MSTKKIINKIISYYKSMQPKIQFTKGFRHSKNIVYLLHSNNHKSGGDKVIYRQSEVINKQAIHGITSQILHPENLSFEHTWFEHQVTFKNNLQFDPNNDFVILPEIWALPYANMLRDIGIKYAIYVQNGYLTGVPTTIGHTYEELYDAYSNASLILSISDDTTECIKLTFRGLKTRIIRMYYSVDASKFKIKSNKENLITFMPRKLSSHSNMILYFLNNSLPKHWKVEAIDGLDENGVINVLSRSKIFLSFSEFEGCPLPPLEAALSGNQVVGYTGEGAKEYWNLPIFTEVHCGDIRNYVKQILLKIEQLEQNPTIDYESINTLTKRYDSTAEISSISNFIESVNTILEDV